MLRAEHQPLRRCTGYTRLFGAVAALSAGPVENAALPFSRRGFLKSLSRTALVLSLEDVLRLARPARAEQATPSSRQAYEAPARPAPKGMASPVSGTPLGVQFTDVAKQAGLNVKTIFGGEHQEQIPA
jgi:hypothetical protein